MLDALPTGSQPDEVLDADQVREAWEDDPTLTLLRGTSARWVLPLFSEHLEFATGPVSAEWFHTRVAEARALHPEWAGDVSPAEHCKNWVDNRWLVRTRTREGDTAIWYRLSSHSLRALRMVRELVRSESGVSEARLGSISDAVRKLADMADPSPQGRVRRLDAQIADLTRLRDDVAAGRVRGATAEETRRQLGEVLRLTESLPEDFRQLGAMVEQRHREVSRRASAENLGKGDFVEAWLRENDLLDQTPEGRAYRGFAQALSTRAVEQLRADIGDVLRHDLAAGQMSPAERTSLEGMVSALLAEEHVVQENYLRWTASLRRYLTRSVSGRQQRLLSLAEEALDAGLAWAQAETVASPLPDVLGVGPLAVRDLTQAQLWRDPGTRAVEVSIEMHTDALPDSEFAALRLQAGTSPAAVAGTVNRLLAEREPGAPALSGRQVYEATAPEYRRLGTVLSLLDLAVTHGTVTDAEPERVLLVTEAGHTLEVGLPHVRFDTEVRGKDAP